jgi:hypothetical protein
VKLEKQHIIPQANPKNLSQNMDLLMKKEPSLLYVPYLKGCLLSDGHHFIHYLPDFTPAQAQDFGFNPSYLPQIFMKGLKSHLTGYGSMGKVMVLSKCGEYLFVRKSMNSIIMIDLKAKLDNTSYKTKKDYKYEINMGQFQIIDMQALPCSKHLLVLGNKCELRVYDFGLVENSNNNNDSLGLLGSKEILRQHQVQPRNSNSRAIADLRFRTEY